MRSVAVLAVGCVRTFFRFPTAPLEMCGGEREGGRCRFVSRVRIMAGVFPQPSAKKGLHPHFVKHLLLGSKQLPPLLTSFPDLTGPGLLYSNFPARLSPNAALLDFSPPPRQHQRAKKKEPDPLSPWSGPAQGLASPRQTHLDHLAPFGRIVSSAVALVGWCALGPASFSSKSLNLPVPFYSWFLQHSYSCNFSYTQGIILHSYIYLFSPATPPSTI